MSARTKKDLPPEETAAVALIEILHEEKRIKRISSKMTKIEQMRWTDVVERAALLEDTDTVSMVQRDHRVLEISTLDYRRRGFTAVPSSTTL